MASGLRSSWFEDGAMTHAVQSLEEQATKAAQTDAPLPAPDDTMRTQWIVVAIVAMMLLGLLAFLGVRAARRGDLQLTRGTMARGAAIVVVLLGGGVIATRIYHVAPRTRGGKRDEALKQLTERTAGLRQTHFAAIAGPSVGTIPWLPTEIDVVVNCNLTGSYDNHPLAVLECTHVVDVTLGKIEATMGRLAAKIMSHVEHEGVQRRSAEAMVFYEPLAAVPDLYLAPMDEPTHWYFQKLLPRGGAPIRLSSGKEYWLASSSADGVCALTPAIERALSAHPGGVVVQVMSGYCSVIPKTWHYLRPGDMPNTPEQIEADLKLACTLYDALRGDAPRVSRPIPVAAVAREVPPATPAPAPRPEAPSPGDDSAAVATAPTPAPASSQPWYRAIGACIGAVLIGALALALELPHAPPEQRAFAPIVGRATVPMIIGAALGAFIGHRVLRNTWRRLLLPGSVGLLCTAVAMALKVPELPPEKVNFSLVLAYAMVFMTLGGIGGAILGWLLRLRK
jgi:fluoride ion exporter CrcB/FEX